MANIILTWIYYKINWKTGGGGGVQRKIWWACPPSNGILWGAARDVMQEQIISSRII